MIMENPGEVENSEHFPRKRRLESEERRRLKNEFDRKHRAEMKERAKRLKADSDQLRAAILEFRNKAEKEHYKILAERKSELSIINAELLLAIINLILELSQAALEQLSSHGVIKNRHAVALALMLMSFISLLLCFVDIWFKRLKGEEIILPVSRSRKRNSFCYSWFDVAGYGSAFLQLVLTVINYFLFRGRSKIQIGITLMPIVYATAVIWPITKERRRIHRNKRY